jgi:hypothetical protein
MVALDERLSAWSSRSDRFTLPAAPRFRNSIVGPAVESCRNAKRPHSVISMSSSVSSGSTSSANSGGPVNSMNLSFESACDSPKPYHRSATLNSQCSTGLYTFSDLGSYCGGFSSAHATSRHIYLLCPTLCDRLCVRRREFHRFDVVN